MAVVLNDLGRQKDFLEQTGCVQEEVELRDCEAVAVK